MDNDPNELVTVYTVSNPIEAEIIKNALVDEGIACVLDNELQAAGLTGLDIKVQVPVSQASRAREFVAAHERDKIRRAEKEEEE
jgi:hypothetical protein